MADQSATTLTKPSPDILHQLRKCYRVLRHAKATRRRWWNAYFADHRRIQFQIHVVRDADTLRRACKQLRQFPYLGVDSEHVSGPCCAAAELRAARFTPAFESSAAAGNGPFATVLQLSTPDGDTYIVQLNAFGHQRRVPDCLLKDIFANDRIIKYFWDGKHDVHALVYSLGAQYRLREHGGQSCNFIDVQGFWKSHPTLAVKVGLKDVANILLPKGGIPFPPIRMHGMMFTKTKYTDHELLYMANDALLMLFIPYALGMTLVPAPECASFEDALSAAHTRLVDFPVTCKDPLLRGPSSAEKKRAKAAHKLKVPPKSTHSSWSDESSNEVLTLDQSIIDTSWLEKSMEPLSTWAVTSSLSAKLSSSLGQSISPRRRRAAKRTHDSSESSAKKVRRCTK